MSLPLNTVPSNFSGFFSSEIVEIVTESGKRRFFVHSDVLAAQSELLKGALTFLDDGTKKIELPESDGNTVERLVQFLYFGNYQFPELISEEEDTEQEGGDNSGGCHCGRGSDSYGDGDGGIEKNGMDTPDTVQSLVDQELGGRVANVLLVHAKLYVLTNAGALKAMALDRLRMTLEEIGGRIARRTSGPRVISDVIELLGYINSHTGSYGEPYTNSAEPIRKLVSTFAAKNFVVLMKQKQMGFFLKERGDLVVELMQEVASVTLVTEEALYNAKERLCTMEKEVQGWENRATAPDEKLRELETANAEKIQQLEAEQAMKQQQLEMKIHQLELAHKDEIRQLEVASVNTLKRLQSLNERKINWLFSMSAQATKNIFLDTKWPYIDIV